MKHGGKRTNCGRKPNPLGPSKTVRVPEQWLPMFEVWLEQRKRDHLDGLTPQTVLPVPDGLTSNLDGCVMRFTDVDKHHIRCRFEHPNMSYSTYVGKKGKEMELIQTVLTHGRS